MRYLDVDQLNARFWTSPLTYMDADGVIQTLSADQKQTENQPDQEVDETAPWVRWTISPGASKMVQSGPPPLYKSLGMATLQIFIPKGFGVGAAIDIKEDFLNSFREWRSDDKRLHIYKDDEKKGSDKTSLQVNVMVFYKSLRHP